MKSILEYLGIILLSGGVAGGFVVGAEFGKAWGGLLMFVSILVAASLFCIAKVGYPTHSCGSYEDEGEEI